MKKFFCLLLVLAMTASVALAEGGLTDFVTTDIEGHVVTQDIFADYDLTVVNIWATWCGYCIDEMPELSQLKTMLPDNVNFITLCEDASSDLKLAGDILRSAGANFQTLVVNEDIYEQFLYQVYAFPTTCFLNSEGMPVAQPLVGVPSLDGAADAYYAITMSILDLLEGRT